MTTWRDRARLAMDERKLTQQELGDRIGVTQGAIQHWLKGSRQAHLETIDEIADAIGVSRVWLTHGVAQDSLIGDLPSWAQGPLRTLAAGARSGTLTEEWFHKRLAPALQAVLPDPPELPFALGAGLVSSTAVHAKAAKQRAAQASPPTEPTEGQPSNALAGSQHE